MKIKIVIASNDTSKGYVANDMPLEFTSVMSKAKELELTIDPLNIEELETGVWKFLENCINQTGELQWTLNISSDTGESLGAARIDDVRIALATAESLCTPIARSLREFCGELSAYLMAKSLELSMKKVAGTFATVAGTADTTGASVSTSSGTPSADVDDLIDKIKKKSKADIVKPKETLKDYMCDDVLKDELLEVKNFFENAAVYKAAGVKIPKGILFKGVPGTGKTYAARCIAGDVDCYFMTCTASSLQGMYIGSGAENIRNVFEGAKALHEATHKGVIIFFDELDSLGSREHHNGSASGEEDRTLNQLLAEMSGFEDVEGIMVLGATNYPERIDEALMRSGRFSRQIAIELPEDNERRSLVSYYFGKLSMKFDTECDIDTVTMLTEGLTPADISEIVNEAGILAIRAKKDTIYLADINEAVNKVITKNIRKPDKDADFHKLVAIHECGHVLAEYIYSHTLSLKVTNYSYGDAGGFTQPGKQAHGIISETEYKARVLGLLGGRAAEEALLGYITTGASEDFARAKKMITRFYETYHFDTYTYTEKEQVILDTLQAWYNECVEEFRTPVKNKALLELSTMLCAERVLYAKDIAAVLSKYTTIKRHTT